MGLFSRKKQEDTGCPRFLKTADAAYVLAFQTKRLGDLQKYLTKGCCTRLLERIRMSNAECVGIERYKKTTWSRESNNTYVKHVTFEDINMGCSIMIPLGDPYIEYWILIDNEGRTLIDDIRRVSC